jgi:hypothetical protein
LSFFGDAMIAAGCDFSNARTTVLGSERMENTCLRKLMDAYRCLKKNDGALDTKTESGRESCQAYLDNIQAAIMTLRVGTACRQYRSAFTANYRVLFPDEDLRYRLDVFEASIEQRMVVWVNGDKYELSESTMKSAKALQQSFAELSWLLKKQRSRRRQTSDELCPQLKRFDGHWASFEKAYMCDLIEIETKSRSLIVIAVEQERLLEMAEKQEEQDRGTQAEATTHVQVKQRRRDLIASICRLNSVANNRRKGRDDLAPTILEEAVKQLNNHSQQFAKEENAASLLSRDIVDSFDAVRSYLREVSTCLERVDPHFSNNVGLVGRLSDWEEKWEVGAQYIRHVPLLHALVDVVAELRQTEEVAPALKDMRNDCDVELFFCIPRILWLRFLERPEQCQELLKNLLPHYFASGTSLEQRALDGKLKELAEQFRQIQQSLSICDVSNLHAWELLARRSIAGQGASDDLYALFVPQNHRDAAKESVEKFMLEIEKWSMELQRHSPEDWNQCCSVLVRCLDGNEARKTAQEFEV